MMPATESIQPSIIKNVPGIHESSLHASDTKQTRMSPNSHPCLMKEGWLPDSNVFDNTIGNNSEHLQPVTQEADKAGAGLQPVLQKFVIKGKQKNHFHGGTTFKY